MHNETDCQKMKQISTALLETCVSGADLESSRWSAANSKTVPNWGHPFSPAPAVCRKDDPLQERVESHSICFPTCHLGLGSANRRLAHQLLTTHRRTSAQLFLHLIRSLLCVCCHPSFLTHTVCHSWTLQQGMLWHQRHSCYIHVNHGHSLCSAAMR